MSIVNMNRPAQVQATWEQLKAVGFWQPEQGTELTCTLLKRIEGKYGSQMLVRASTGDLLFLPQHKALESLLVTVVPGDELRILPDGEKASTKQGMKAMQLYKVFVRRNPDNEVI